MNSSLERLWPLRLLSTNLMVVARKKTVMDYAQVTAPAR
jgi:hypothetical protein